MDALKFLRSNSEYLSAVATLLKETGIVINGEIVKSDRLLANQTIVKKLKAITDEQELVQIIDALGLSDEFNNSSSEDVAQAQATATVDLSGEDVREFSHVNQAGKTVTAPIVMLEYIGLSGSGKRHLFRMKSGKTVISAGTRAFQLVEAGAIKVGDLVAFNPSSIKPASYAVGYYEGGMNISANANAVKLYKARAKNTAKLIAHKTNLLDAGMSKEQVAETVAENVKKVVGDFVPERVTFE